MKREIKFRGQRKMNGEWVFGSLISIGEDWDQIIPLETEYDDLKQEMTRVMTHSIGQFTGLTDKNGVEIYEGDILSIHSPCIDSSLPWKPAKNYRIGWYKRGCWNLFKSITDEHVGIVGITLSNLQYFEIIGNIHQNQELL